jgi:hypothetical protein
MRSDAPSPETLKLRSLMDAVDIPSFRALSRVADVSDWQIRQLRQGHIAQMRLEVLQKLSHALQLSLNQLLEQFLNFTSDEALLPLAIASTLVPQPADPELEALQQEYQRLQHQLKTQRDDLLKAFQQASIQTIESWLLQWPTAAHAAQQNPQIPAARLLPLIRPIEQLIETWGVEAIAPVGAEVPYEPQLHQLMDGTASPGTLVKVRYTGYRQGNTLLYRAKVSPV